MSSAGGESTSSDNHSATSPALSSSADPSAQKQAQQEDLSSSSQPPKPKNKTAIELEKLVVHLINLIKHGEYKHPDVERHVASNFTAHVEHTAEPVVTSREQLFARYREIFEADPDYQHDITSVRADVDEQKGTATVWVCARVTTKDIQVESITIMYWERVKGNWRCFMQDGMRGMGGDT